MADREFALPGSSGLSCAACGEALCRVSRTRHTEGFTIRDRICAKCGKLNESYERVVRARDRRNYFSGPKD